MKFRYGKNDFKSLKRGQEYCYLLTNGLGGFSSTTIINSLTRNDHSLFMACTKAPNNRKNIISKVSEILHIDNKKIDLSSQQYVSYTKNKEGYKYLLSFTQEYLPEWTYFYDGIKLKKTIVYEHGKNTLGVKYTIDNNTTKNVRLEIKPVFVFAKRGEILPYPHKYIVEDDKITANDMTLYLHSNYNEKVQSEINFENDYYFDYDAVDGRDSIGSGTTFISYFYDAFAKSTNNFELIFTLENEVTKNIDTLIENEIKRQKELIRQAGFHDDLANTLVRASDQFLSYRESTDSLTILAGFPWFEDWGRDTMFSVLGSAISTNRFDEAKDIFRTFIKYIHKGLMPNLFPEGGVKPLYNTVDASLLYIYALYEYYTESLDIDFIKDECYNSIVDIISWYKKGTDFNIYMDDDYLINAGDGFDQVTWMDVRFGEILPTARHGKPVEINAYWYNALKIASYFGKKFGLDVSEYESISKHVNKSFNDKFWNDKENCLKDVVSGNDYDNQVRCNQIWAVMVPFSPLDNEKGKLVLDKVYNELYTPYGLRTLSKYDKEFAPTYGGSHFKRDMSYHQGTVWPFPLGGYYITYLKVHDYSKEAISKVREELSFIEDCLREGCVGQIAEIYDGLYPNESRGCFAQAWSVSEILRVFKKISNK